MPSLKLGLGARWDGEKEVTLDDPRANKLLQRRYRDSRKYPWSDDGSPRGSLGVTARMNVVGYVSNLSHQHEQ